MKWEHVSRWLQKLETYKYTCLVLVLGIGLLVLPQGCSTERKTTETECETTQPDLEPALETLLSKIEGAGKVDVLLTLSEGVAYEYQTDRQQCTEIGGDVLETQTVLISDSAGTQTPVKSRTIYPVYQGAVIVCQGANSAKIRLAITEAVSSLTGLGADKITVIKMKSS